MNYKISDELITICHKIMNENKTEEEWAKIESDDMFQSANFVGGFDADEREFCFSLYDADKEYWFQLSLGQIEKIIEGKLTTIDVRTA